MAPTLLHFDPANYLRIDHASPIGTSGSGASFATSTGDVLEVSCFGPGAFRLRMGLHARPDYGILVGRAQPCTVGKPKSGEWTFEAGPSRLTLSGSPLAFALAWEGRTVLTSATDLDERGTARLPTFGRIPEGGEWTAALALASGEAVYGLGEKFGPLDKRGQLAHSQVEDRGGVNTGSSGANVPFAWSPGHGRGAWGVFVHTPGRVAHGVGFPDWSHRSYALVVDDEALDLFVLAADAPAGVVDVFTQLTGRPSAVPRWSLGLWLDGSGSAGAAVGAAASLRERKIPCDVLMLDDDRFRGDPAAFDDARAALAAIRAHDLRVGARETPWIAVDDPLFADLAERGYLLKDAAGDPCVQRAHEAAGAPSPVGVVDFTNPGAFVWWRDAHKALFEDGVDLVACDLDQPLPDDALAHNGDGGRRLHNVHALLHARCVHEATDKFQRPGNAPAVVWSRAAWTGQQRCPVSAGAQAQADWEGVAASIRGALSCGMSGNPHAGPAALRGPPADAEVALRWLQAAVFAPHCWIRAGDGREPWASGPQAEAVARKWLAFRYRLLPYLEHALAQATTSGLPPMRAMPLAFPRNVLLARFETQFMCGDALLVAPIVAPDGEVEVALPPGAWYDLNSRQRYAGRQVLRYRAALDQFPAFGREGHVLPLGRAVQHTGEIDAQKPLERLWVFGPPAVPLAGFAQVAVDVDGETAVVRAADGVSVQVFGDAPVAVEKR